MKEDRLYIANCLDVIKTKVKSADYVFTVPPDFSEVGLNPKKDFHKYFNFLRDVLDLLCEITTRITISITDRKFDGRIIPKHAFFIDYFKTVGWHFKSQKIWIKSDKVNLFRLNYSHVMTFCREKVAIRKSARKNFSNDCLNYRIDYKGFAYGIPAKVVELHIEAFTKKRQVVFDPFAGSCTTAVAAIMTYRHFVGSEINKAYACVALNRIQKFNQSLFISERAKKTPFKVIEL